MSRPMLLALLAVLSASVTHAQPQPLAAHWLAVDATGAIDLAGAQRLGRALHIGLADGSGTDACPAGVWTGQATYTGGADGTLIWWGTGFGCVPHGVGTLQYPDGSSYFGRVTSFVYVRGVGLQPELFRPAVPDGPGQLYTPSTGVQRLGRFSRGAFSADLSTDARFVAAYQAAYASIADRAAPTLTAAVAQLFAVVAPGPQAQGGGTGTAAPLFPAGVERTAEIKRIEELVQRFESPAWRSEVSLEVDDDMDLQGKAGWAVFVKTGFVDCAVVQRQGTVIVQDGGQSRTGFQRFRGDLGPCGPTGVGLVDYANGTRFVGKFINETNGKRIMLYRHGLGAWLYPDGSRLVAQFERGEFLGGGHLKVEPAGASWIQGPLDIAFNSPQAVYATADGTTFRGRLMGGRPNGAGTWRFESATMQITGVGAEEAGRAVLKGPMEVVLRAPVAFPDGVTLGAGRFALDAGKGWSPGGTLAGAALRPVTASLAVATKQPPCPLQATPPAGWKVWGPSCTRRGAEGWQVDSYAPDGRFVLQQRSRDGRVIDESSLIETRDGSPLLAARTWVATQFELGSPPAPLGETQYFEEGVLRFVGSISGLTPSGAGLCAIPAEEGQGLEPCEFRAGQRVDQLFHLRRQRQLQTQQTAQQQAQQRAAVAAAQQAQQQQAAAAAAAAAAQQKQGGFQWGKFAALATGAVLGGATELDASTQMDVLGKIAMDSMAGNDGISNLQTLSTASATPSLGAATGAGGGQGAVAAGSYPARPNTLDGDPACSGYSVDNYKSFYAQNSAGPDAQLHSLCAAAYNYYWMYLNAIRQGYAQADSDRTYAAFSDAARVATGFYRSAR